MYSIIFYDREFVYTYTYAVAINIHIRPIWLGFTHFSRHNHVKGYAKGNMENNTLLWKAFLAKNCDTICNNNC